MWNPALFFKALDVLGAGFLFVVLTFVVYQLAHWRVRERSEHRTLEAHVAERTNELHATNEQLQRKITERRYVEQALRQAHDELESIVKERTQELQSTKENLQSACRWHCARLQQQARHHSGLC